MDGAASFVGAEHSRCAFYSNSAAEYAKQSAALLPVLFSIYKKQNNAISSRWRCGSLISDKRKYSKLGTQPNDAVKKKKIVFETYLNEMRHESS